MWTDIRYRYGILVALSYDIWDHYILRFVEGVLDGFPEGFMARLLIALKYCNYIN